MGAKWCFVQDKPGCATRGTIEMDGKKLSFDACGNIGYFVNATRKSLQELTPPLRIWADGEYAKMGAWDSNLYFSKQAILIFGAVTLDDLGIRPYDVTRYHQLSQSAMR